jgi:hypothetical protein
LPTESWTALVGDRLSRQDDASAATKPNATACDKTFGWTFFDRGEQLLIVQRSLGARMPLADRIFLL